MASKFRQDLPPEGGYGPINWARKIPKRGLSGAAIFGIFAGVTGLGWTAYYFELQARRKWRLEMNDARLAIEPLLLAEEHRQYLRHCRKTRDAENELMKDVPGWVTGTYYGEKLYNNTDRFPYLHPEGYYALNNPKDMYNRVYERHWH